MRRIISAILCVVAMVWAIDASARFPRGTPNFVSNPNLRQENFFGLTGSAWQTPSTYYVPGTGNPAVSTSDYMQQDGVAWMKPYDLASADCVAAGASTANGRYLWTSSADHASDNYVFAGNAGFRLGFSNDPGVPPATMRLFYYPATVTAVAPVATITADISGNTLNVSAITGGMTFDSNAQVSGSGVVTATITGQSSGSRGQVGGYTINGAPQTVSSRTMTVSQSNYSIYQNPDFVCDPDDVSFPFKVYAEGSASGVQHEQGVIKSADLVTWTSPVPSHVTWTFGSFGSWSSYQRVKRDSTGVWHSTGFNSFYTAGNVFGSGKWTSADGLIWAPNLTTLFNVCLPPNTTGPVGKTYCPDLNATQVEFGAAPDSITIGAQAWSPGRTSFYPSGNGVRTGTQTVVRAPIDANFNVLASPALVNISSPYGGVYPGPTFLQSANAYVEDGIIHYYAQTGFPVSTGNNGLVSGATYANGGGLWQQGLDYYTEIIDATAAAGAAPVGVRASCAASTATVNWYGGILPTDTMRLYRGTTAGSQTTLVGDFTGTSATDTGMTLNAVTYYKLVYLNGGVEKKNRVVSTYCSTSSVRVNGHLTRALAAGADPATCNRTFMDAFDAWLVSNGRVNNLLLATSADFCVAQSGNITKIFDMGTTRLPRGGDFTPTTSNTTYSATGINGKPAWVNSTSTAYGIYGDGRGNNIQRKTQITLFAAYQKPNTNTITPFITGQFGSRIMLQHASGSPGSISCLLSDATQQKNATAAVAGLATDVHTASCTFDGTNWLAWSDAVAGSLCSGCNSLVIPSPSLNPPDMLTGQVGLGGLNSIRVLASGGDGALLTVTTGALTISSNQAQYSGRLQAVFDIALTGAEQTSLDALAR